MFVLTRERPTCLLGIPAELCHVVSAKLGHVQLQTAIVAIFLSSLAV